ncbi:Dimer-Tnp-hAT domain containing protein [Pyrenophora tritici-repentis]|nr:Dimer-Tnp-hAT domain containing protein [Pyrenophora tritici-repentis]
MANPEAEAALWTSSMSVSRYVLRLYDYLKPRVVKELSQALSKIHVSFDGWTTKGGKRGYLGSVVHYVDARGNLQDLPIALPQLTGAHSGQKMAEVVLKTLDLFSINAQIVGYFRLGFSASDRRHRCGPHTLNLVGQRLLWGQDEDAYDNDKRELADETEFMGEWRRDGPLGVLLSVINYIKTPQQYELFSSFQTLAHRELPTDAPEEDRKVLEPVKPVVTRWNSYYSCFERAVKLQSAVNAYANHHIRRVRDEDTYAESRSNKLPEAPRWMRSDGLTAADWAVVTEYLDVLKPLKSATKRLEGRGKSGRFGAIAEIIPVFEYILSYYEQRVKAYEAVDYNAHDEAPEDHLAINLCAVWAKISEYYAKLDDSPAYYAATILHPYYKTYCDTVWSDKPEWLVANNRNFRALWQLYSASPRKVRRPKVLTSDMDDAIDGLINPSASINNNTDHDEFERWKRSEPRAEKGSNYANNPIKYWVELRERYPNLSKLALDVLSIPASSCECERLFSELGDLLEPRRRAIKPQLLAATQAFVRP